MGTSDHRPLTAPALGPGQPRCLDCTIRLQAVCAHAGAAELAELERIKRYRSYAPGQVIAASGYEPFLETAAWFAAVQETLKRINEQEAKHAA